MYGFEYVPGFDNGYITWISDNKAAWTVKAAGLGPDPLTEIAARPVPVEPMVMSLVCVCMDADGFPPSTSLPILGSRSTLVGSTLRTFSCLRR